MKAQPTIQQNFLKMLTTAALALAVLIPGAIEVSAQRRAPKTKKPQPNSDAAVVEVLREMQKELREIKVLLAPRPQAAPQAAPDDVVLQAVSLDLANRPFRGSKDAPITIVEITDYECPFCSRHARQTLPEIEKEFIATGKVKYYVIDLPLEEIHPNAFKAAVAVRCAGEDGKYWEMHERLFASKRDVFADWTAHAQAVGLETEKFVGCVKSDKYTADVRKDMALAQKIGVQGTPGFYFATTEKADSTKAKTVSFMNGARPYATMKQQLDGLLKQKPQPQKQTAKAGGQ